ncbi:hypothetical protein SAMN04488128_106316 [Chitinophaga eiseniae]|uniref:FG-GAP repeat-containing protein n=1 Tax=Chitinophaga eiseniae TaxID=634771 RepID=A0A1T4TUB3_9BACT|nr:hypothetical protein [Chitinophaga eiseniae]SKA44042.1 hypothetical protein SAMN04488128_106316 [Chitinophaga eiseniae]
MKIAFLFLALLTTTVTRAQQPAGDEAYKKFIPAGYEVRDVVNGDLNGDHVPDVVLVLQPKAASPSSDAPESRPFMILLSNHQHQLSLAVTNKDIILPADIGGTLGDPYVSTTIDNCSFTIEQYYGSRERTRTETTFCYVPAKKDWLLNKVVTTTEDALNADAAKTIVKKGKQLKPVSIKKYTGD